MSGKFELARIQTRLLHVDAKAIQHDTFASWLDRNVTDAAVRGILEMLGRVTTFTNDPDHQSAGAAIEQLQLALRGNVRYLDGGWQTIVDGLRSAALNSGVRIVPNAHAVGFDRSGPREVSAVRLADGCCIAASAVIIAAGPSEVDALAGTDFEPRLTPLKMATLDLALRSLPKPSAKVAFGIDAPLYLSVHSAVAQLAPSGGALIHVSKYLRPGERVGAETERELETLMDMMQPGWRAVVESKQFLPALTVTHAELTAAQGGAAGRPAARLDTFDNVAIAGDWIGPRGQLSDAAAASAADAVAHVKAALNGRRLGRETGRVARELAS